MKVTAFNQLKKLMQMTTSDNDTEALTAIRKANKIIAEANVTWERVFARLVTVDVEESPDVEDFRPASQVPRDLATERKQAYLRQLLEDAEQAATGRFADFVGDLRRQYEEKGWLSPAQIQALEGSRNRRPGFR